MCLYFSWDETLLFPLVLLFTPLICIFVMNTAFLFSFWCNFPQSRQIIFEIVLGKKKRISRISPWLGSHRSTDYHTQRGGRGVWRRANWIWWMPGKERGQLLSQQKSFFIWFGCRTVCCRRASAFEWWRGKRATPCSADISINFTFSLTKFGRKKRQKVQSHLAMPHYVRGKRRQWGVGRVGVCPMRSCKGNGLAKGSPNRTAALMTELTQKKGFVVFGESVKSFLTSLLCVKQLSLTWEELLMKYLYIIDTSPLLSTLIFAFDLPSLKLPSCCL